MGRLLDAGLPGEVRSILASPNRQQALGCVATRGLAFQGPITDGRPVTGHIPIYQPVLDLIYQLRGKGKVTQETAPIKMALSGSVGVLGRTEYSRQEVPLGNLPATPEKGPEVQRPDARGRTEDPKRQGREGSAALGQRVAEAAERNPLLGTMTAAFLAPAEAARQDRQAPPPTRGDGGPARGEVETQAVTETAGTRGRGSGGSGSEGGHSQGDRGGGESRGSSSTSSSGSTGGAAPGGAPSSESQARMQAYRLASTNEAFRITMDKLENQLSMRRYDVAVRNANTSIETILKRVYRDQELSDLDERDAVNSLVLMLKLGGDFTYAHSTRVLDYAMDLADEMGITDEETRKQIELGALLKDVGELGLLMEDAPDDKLLRIANFMSSQDMLRVGLLHDIGKLRIPPEIVCKPGRMTEEEYEIMKMHPIYGEQILYPIAALRHLCPTVRGHHERWDGKGYPDGLRGERIPLPARILSVADVFDALHAERPYKSGLDIGRVRAMLEEGRGTHFDPDCVDAFLRILDRRFPQVATRRRAFKRKLESVDA